MAWPREEIKRKTTQAAKKLLTSIKEKGPHGKKIPLPEKKKAVRLLSESVRIRTPDNPQLRTDKPADPS